MWSHTKTPSQPARSARIATRATARGSARSLKIGMNSAAFNESRSPSADALALDPDRVRRRPLAPMRVAGEEGPLDVHPEQVFGVLPNRGDGRVGDALPLVGGRVDELGRSSH